MPVGAKKKMTDMEIAKANRMQMLTEERNTIRKYDPDALAAFDRELKAKGYMVNKKPVKKMSEGGEMDMYKKGGAMNVKKKGRPEDNKNYFNSEPNRGVVKVDSESTRTVKDGKTEYVSVTNISDNAGKSQRIVSNKDGESSTAFARKSNPTQPVKVGPSSPGKTMANINGRGYSNIEKDVRPGISNSQSVSDLEKAKKMMYRYGGKMKKYLMGGQVKLDKNKDGKITSVDFKMLKKYQAGGTVPAKKDFVGKGLFPKDPTSKSGPTELEILEGLTWQKSVEALKRRGVSNIDQSEREPSRKILGQGNTNILDNNYELAIKKAKEYGVYDEARQEAVKEYRSKKPSAGGQK